MPPLGNARHESFAQAVASSKSASEAYRLSGARGKNADVHAARLMVNDGISKRVAELKAVQAQKSELSRDELREFLTEVILTPAGKVNEQSRLSGLRQMLRACSGISTAHSNRTFWQGVASCWASETGYRLTGIRANRCEFGNREGGFHLARRKVCRR